MQLSAKERKNGWDQDGALLTEVFQESCQKLNLFFVVLFYFRMAPEVIACDEQPDATYDNRVC